MEQGEEQWQSFQIKNWKDDKKQVVNFFNRFNLDISDVYDHITAIDYDKMQIICYLISKVMLARRLCDYLDTLKKSEHQDVDVVKVYLLVSHAEIAMNNFGIKDKKIMLVKKFFEPILDKYRLDYKMRVSPDYVKNEKGLSFPEVLYKIRCDYTHEGNYTGIIFKNRGEATNIFSFNDKGKVICGECNLTYDEFTNIYMDALIENIKIFSDLRH